MKKQITAAMMILTMIAAPAMANSMDNQAFENQVFHTQADTPMQLAELSQKEMKETEGAWVALAWRGVTVMSRGFTHIIKGSKLSQGQAVNVLRNGGNVITNNQRYSAKLAQNELAPKSWTLIKAYSGALCKPGSVCDRTQLFQFQTATLPVVVIHIVIYLLHQFIYRQFTCVIETLRL